VPGPPAVSANDLRRFFAVFAANHQRQTIPSPQERSILGGVVEEKQAAAPPMPDRLVRSLATIQMSPVAWWLQWRVTKSR
jgi:hypothetical protein